MVKRFLRRPAPLTENVSHGDAAGGFGGLAHAGGVAAAHAEAVRFPFAQVEQGKAGRLDGHAGVHPLPRVGAWNALKKIAAVGYF